MPPLRHQPLQVLLGVMGSKEWIHGPNTCPISSPLSSIETKGRGAKTMGGVREAVARSHMKSYATLVRYRISLFMYPSDRAGLPRAGWRTKGRWRRL
jgi:hypothetical protein